MIDGAVTGAAEDDSWASVCDELERDVRRVADRLRSLSQARLAAAVPPHSSRAAAARAVAQGLADAAAGIEGRTGARPPGWRPLPDLGDFAAGDQIAVTGRDLLAVCAGTGPQETVWTRAGRQPAHQAVTAAWARLAELRRLL